MEETIVDNLENAPENVENEPEEPVQAEPQPEPKKRGRPAGAKDRAPRKKIKIVAEPLAPPEEPEPSEPSQPSQPSQLEQAPEPVPEPPSPRTLHRQAAELILHLNNQRSEARRAQMRDMYTKNLAIY